MWDGPDLKTHGRHGSIGVKKFRAVFILLQAVLKEEHSQLLTGQDLLDLVTSLEEKQKRLLSTFNQLPCLVMTTTRKREKEVRDGVVQTCMHARLVLSRALGS